MNPKKPRNVVHRITAVNFRQPGIGMAISHLSADVRL
jgi:hypothetical protein